MSVIAAYEVRATPESVSRWQIGRDARLAPPPADGAPLPLSYLMFLRMQPILGVSIHRLLERDPDRGLFGGVRYRAGRLPRVGARYAAAASLTDRKQAGELTITTLSNRYSDDGVMIVEETVRMVDLPQGPPRAPGRGPERPPSHPRLVRIGPVSRTQIAWFTVESGDLNPLHFDSSYAASRLYADVVVPGTLLAALVEREAAAALGAPLLELDLRLRAPSYPGDELTLHARPRSAEMDFELFCGAELRAEGRARAMEARP